jgi:pimeloyl-ACP methyl ester carboxylesterase
MIDVGGHRLHVVCSGAGGPTVLFESGLGDGAAVWRKVQPQVATFTRTCSYDRAGIGYSESAPAPRDSKRIAEELHTALEGASEKGPYVLVGHSAGGLHARVFAAHYPNEVAGLVLVDPTAEELLLNPPPAAAPVIDVMNRVLPVVATLRVGAAYLGWSRAAGGFGDDGFSGGCTACARERAAARREILAMEQDAREAAGAHVRGDLPVLVLSSSKPTPARGLPLGSLLLPRGLDAAQGMRAFDDAKAAAHAAMVRRSKRGKLIVTGMSGHYIHIDEPELVSGAIHEIVTGLR